jgi:hypothetical protein
LTKRSKLLVEQVEEVVFERVEKHSILFLQPAVFDFHAITPLISSPLCISSWQGASFDSCASYYFFVRPASSYSPWAPGKPAVICEREFRGAGFARAGLDSCVAVASSATKR